MSGFEKNTVHKVRDGRHEIDCRRGLWGVSASSREQALREAQHYYMQYELDGEYEEIMKCEYCGDEWKGSHQCEGQVVREPLPVRPESAGWVSNEEQYRKLLVSIVRCGERQGIKRVVQLCDMTLRGMDVFTDSRMKM